MCNKRNSKTNRILNSIFQNEVKDLFSFRDLFFENHPLEMASKKNERVEEKKKLLVEKFESIDGRYILR